ncbi:Fluoroacetate dehalogenase [Roseivivax jejudonensis]|uniref:Fluoroacetate dehalogenase n=1 Tax=Roseivivax jejudonensis TaxID=1529041 RepID=A0A1X6ZNL8_9RHOB|nr:alpha/beta fold hydrolase BchO [Roseivivax jejudonensis]SLN56523.1 Fluoroacetate dehalogenase [Roseivivax jejudonensis]
MDFSRDLAGWPHAESSRQIPVRPHRWHVQVMGEGPDLLFLHGAGGSTHSWRDVMPRLADRYRCIAVDLPGHGFTRIATRFRSSLPFMAEDLGRLMAHEGWQPAGIVAHSAGAAVALRLAAAMDTPPRIVAFNPALEPFRGMAGLLFPMAARMIAMTPFATSLVRGALVAPERAAALLAGTGSRLDAEGVGYYRRLLRDRAHVEGALLMMSQWSLTGLLEDLPGIHAPTLILLGETDRTVPPDGARAAAARLPDARCETLPGLGHLAHEEAPDAAAERIERFMAETVSA